MDPTHVRGVAVSQPLVGIDVSDPQAIQTGPLERLLLPLNHRLAADITLSIRTLDIDPPLLYEALRYYHQPPEARDELATQDGLARVRHGQFSSTQPAEGLPSRCRGKPNQVIRTQGGWHGA